MEDIDGSDLHPHFFLLPSSLLQLSSAKLVVQIWSDPVAAEVYPRVRKQIIPYLDKTSVIVRTARCSAHSSDIAALAEGIQLRLGCWFPCWLKFLVHIKHYIKWYPIQERSCNNSSVFKKMHKTFLVYLKIIVFLGWIFQSVESEFKLINCKI